MSGPATAPPEQARDGRTLAPLVARDILTAIGEVVYEWSIPDDAIFWGSNALDVLKIDTLDRIARGSRFAMLVDPSGPSDRHEAVLNSKGTDDGAGVPYVVQYAILPGAGRDGQKLWIEDTGRWYAGPDGKPLKTHGVLRVINQRHEEEQRLSFLSRHDELTGYFNRSHLLETLAGALADAIRHRTSISFLIVALDNFGVINDAYGFGVADQAFAEIAHRVRNRLRDGDSIGRYAGNKLGILLRNCSEGDMHVAAERFHQAIHADIVNLGGGSVAVAASIGGVLLPRNGQTVDEAIIRAEEALHVARVHGQRRFTAYVQSERRETGRRRNAAISSELVSALNEKRYRLAYQPIVDIDTRRPAYHEALLRLDRPESETTLAADFIALSEKLGLVRLLDYRALELAIEVLTEVPDASLAVNVSAKTLGEEDWIAYLAAAAARNPGLPRRLIVEITESAIVGSLDEASHFVATVHALGGRVAVDDFGAGHTSFRNLRALDVDIVKIDGIFIEHLKQAEDDRAFVRALVDLSRSLGIETVAEWVQDEETAVMLAAMGVNRIQGNLCGPATLESPWAIATAKNATG
jgi:diguanylate cyclase (GGDEF)-like protein